MSQACLCAKQWFQRRKKTSAPASDISDIAQAPLSDLSQLSLITRES